MTPSAGRLAERSAPHLSVVLASSHLRRFAEPALAELRRQCDVFEAELFVARRETESDASWYHRFADDSHRVAAGPDADVPRLRAAGLAAANGEWVALTEDCCVAAPDWLARLVAAMSPDADYLGGIVENAATSRAVDCGAYYSDWGFYGSAPLGRAGRPPLATAANVAYRRPVIADVVRWTRAGAWENVVHARLHAGGARYLPVPGARVRHHLSHRFTGVVADRFRHGRDYASVRVADLSAASRLARLLFTPALPALLARRVWRSAGRADAATFARALPFTLVFFAAWALGEAAAYTRGAVPQ